MQIAHRVILALTLATMVLCSWLAPLDSTAIQQADAGLKRALISFATARALNAAISFAQGTEVAVQPMGVGVNLTPGQLLDPVNDLVEQFSNLMLAACVAFGVQKILISIGGYWLVSLVLTIAALGWAWIYFRQQQPPAWLAKMLVILLMVRFAIPMVTTGTDLLFQKFLVAEYTASQQAIDTASGQVTELNPPDQPPPEDRGLLEKMKENINDLWSKTKVAVNVKTHFKNLQQAAEQWTGHIINLIVIFLLQTLVFPLLLLWALYGVARGVFEWPRQMSNVATKP
ncbi:MAG: hypothetical protein Q7T21_02350 [Gallionella sp.]|nr:hypothetical protein [Gallionella sp.]